MRALVLVLLGGCYATMADEDPAQRCEGPLGPALSLSQISALPACCAAEGGAAHCLPSADLPAELLPLVDSCDEQSACIPDSFLATAGAVAPTSCTAFGGDGVCLSRCIPQVAENAGLLRPDVCQGVDELCVPCISPIDNQPTGACTLRELATCDGGSSVNPPQSCDDPSTCDYEASCPAVVDPTTLTACAADAHCVDASLIPADAAESLATCPGSTQLCVPDIFITTGGKFTPPTCESVSGAEGRCLSLALPAVKAQEALLPQSTCGAAERCTPCYSPIDGTPTGACTQSCDTGPTEPATTFTECCGGAGKCIATQSIPEDQRGNLDEDDCEEDVELCVPDQILADGPFPACTANSFILGAYTGVCLSDCLSFGIQGIALARGSCADDFKCAPCELNGQPTGAPGCPP